MSTNQRLAPLNTLPHPTVVFILNCRYLLVYNIYASCALSDSLMLIRTCLFQSYIMPRKLSFTSYFPPNFASALYQDIANSLTISIQQYKYLNYIFTNTNSIKSCMHNNVSNLFTIMVDGRAYFTRRQFY